MTSLYVQVMRNCEETSLQPPELISLVGENKMTLEDSNKLKQLLFEMGIDPFAFVGKYKS
jgi:hypothetical protein